jgi:glycogen(starch) synthase
MDQETHDAPQPDRLFEIAWEVARQVGGIYTVIRSKAAYMKRNWGDRYTCIGPWDPGTSPNEFEYKQPSGAIAQALDLLREEGIEAHYGTWLIASNPAVILLNPDSLRAKLGDIKYFLWDHHKISLRDHDDLVDPVACFGYAVERFFHHLSAIEPESKTIAHFHEWMAGTAIPGIRRASLPIRTVFTTHATMLGRYLAGNDPWFYDHVPFVDAAAEAERFNIQPQTQIERAAAHGCHVLSTVSEITAYECEHLLGRKVDQIVPNGLNIERFAAIHEFQNLHLQYKKQINRFVMAHFFPSYHFDLDHTLYFFTSGRYEYRNKGFDMTLEALAQLNHKMKEEGSKNTVVFFLITRRPLQGVKSDVLHQHATLNRMQATCQEIQAQIGERLFHAASMGHVPEFEELVDEFWMMRLRRMIQAWRSNDLPPVVTHNMVDPDDEVLQKIRDCGLINSAEDRVKVVYHGDFLNSTNPLFGMDYDQFVRGCHMGVFPSAYEPWGYTPLECIARGIPAVTSDLAGFGTYMQKALPHHGDDGVLVLPRRFNAYEPAAGELADWLHQFVRLNRRERVDLRNRVEGLAGTFDWKNLGRHYNEAYKQALG